MARLWFYLRYAFLSLYRERRWTAFALFAIGAGVAAVVALRSLGLAIGDSLVDNARTSLGGDILLIRGGDSPFEALFSGDDARFSARLVQQVQDWTAAQGGQMTAFVEASNFQVTPVDVVTAGRPQFVSTFLIDPATYPADGEVRAQDPAGVPLRDLLVGDDAIVISRNLATLHGLNVGDTVRVTGTQKLYTVRGIVATELQANLQDLFASFFGFAYLNVNQADTLQINSAPNRIAIVLPDGTDVNRAANDLRGMGLRPRTLPDLLRTYERIGDAIADFIVVLGLGALLIGGVGVGNTMIVLARRHTEEIAALKTFGLKGGQVALLFLLQALLLGIGGSFVGIVMGVGLSGIVNQFGEQFLQQPLTWRIYPDALSYGLVLGIATTLTFGITPVLLVLRVRPAIILRPNETHVPALGVVQSGLALVLVVLSIGIMAGEIIGSAVAGIIGVVIVLMLMGILVGLLWILVWLVGKLPAFGSVNLRLALRNLSTRRTRTAVTLLALSAGMFALSSITLVAQGTREILQFQFASELGGNIMVLSLASFVSQDVGSGIVSLSVAGLQGVRHTTRIVNHNVTLAQVNGAAPVLNIPQWMQYLPDRARDDMDMPMMGSSGTFSFTVSVRDSDNPNLQPRLMQAGRDLTDADRGQPVMVITDSFAGGFLTLNAGDVLTLRDGNRTLDVTIVGVTAPTSTNFGSAYLPPDVLRAAPEFEFTVLDVAPEALDRALLDLTANPLLFALDISFMDNLVKRLIDQFAAIPTVVGLLSLLAAATIMANTVALATLERRRQIGILKAVGLKGRRVLLIMLLENTLVGVLGALLGIGLAAAGVALMTALGTGVSIPIPRDSALTVAALAAAAVVIAWIATFLSARQAVGERVLNVLRYE